MMAALQLSWTRVWDKWGSGPSATLQSPLSRMRRPGREVCMGSVGGGSKLEGWGQWEEQRNPALSS